jgi:hypothetical protein
MEGSVPILHPLEVLYEVHDAAAPKVCKLHNEEVMPIATDSKICGKRYCPVVADTASFARHEDFRGKHSLSRHCLMLKEHPVKVE